MTLCRIHQSEGSCCTSRLVAAECLFLMFSSLSLTWSCSTSEQRVQSHKGYLWKITPGWNILSSTFTQTQAGRCQEAAGFYSSPPSVRTVSVIYGSELKNDNQRNQLLSSPARIKQAEYNQSSPAEQQLHKFGFWVQKRNERLNLKVQLLEDKCWRSRSCY